MDMVHKIKTMGLGNCQVRDWDQRGKRSRQRRAHPASDTGSSHYLLQVHDSRWSVPVEQPQVHDSRWPVPVEQQGWSYGQTSAEGDWNSNPPPYGYYPQSGDTSSYGYSYGECQNTDYSSAAGSNILPFAQLRLYSQDGSTNTSRPRRGSRSMRASLSGRRSNVQSQSENDRQWFPTDSATWLNAMMTQDEPRSSYNAVNIEQQHGRPLMGYLLENYPDQNTYDTYVSQYEYNYSASMAWQYYCCVFLPQLARGPLLQQNDADFVPARSSFWW